jgi:hypothetical protein
MRDFGAVYESVIDVHQWGEGSKSPFPQALRETTAEDRLSIKFNVDGINLDFGSPHFLKGRITGTIGLTDAAPDYAIGGSLPIRFNLPVF